MIDEAKFKEFQDIYGTLKADAIGEFRPQLEDYHELHGSTGEAIICHADGDVAAYVSGNLGLGFDCQTMAAYIVAACNLAPDLVRENAELRAALFLTAAERDRAEEMSQQVRQANMELRGELAEASEDAANLYRALVLADEVIGNMLGTINHGRLEAMEAHEKRVGMDRPTLMGMPVVVSPAMPDNAIAISLGEEVTFITDLSGENQEGE